MKPGDLLRVLAGAFLVVSLGFLGYAAVRYFSPPPEPGSAPPAASDALRPKAVVRGEYGLERYAIVAGGRMFLGETSPSGPSAPVTSGLVARAIFPGPSARAVLAPVGEPPEGRSWVVKVGDEVEGERVLSISSEYVIVLVHGQRVRLPVGQ